MNDKCFIVEVAKDGYVKVYAQDEDEARLRVENNCNDNSINMQVLWNKNIKIEDVQESEEL